MGSGVTEGVGVGEGVRTVAAVGLGVGSACVVQARTDAAKISVVRITGDLWNHRRRCMVLGPDHRIFEPRTGRIIRGFGQTSAMAPALRNHPVTVGKR